MVAPGSPGARRETCRHRHRGAETRPAGVRAAQHGCAQCQRAASCSAASASSPRSSDCAVYGLPVRFDNAKHAPALQEAGRILPPPTRQVNATFDALDRASIVEVDAVAPVSRDPNDDKFIAAALRAGVDYVVSEDKGLTDLVDVEGVRIVRVSAFLAMLEAERAD